MFVGTVTVSWREMGLHLIDPVPPLPHGQRTMHSAIISVLMLSFLMQNKPTISTPLRLCCDQHKYNWSQTKGKDNNGYHIERQWRETAAERNLCWLMLKYKSSTHNLYQKCSKTKGCIKWLSIGFRLLVSYFQLHHVEVSLHHKPATTSLH